MGAPKRAAKGIVAAPSQPADLGALSAWRAAGYGRIVQVRLGRVTLWPGLGEKPLVFKTIADAVAAVS